MNSCTAIWAGWLCFASSTDLAPSSPAVSDPPELAYRVAPGTVRKYRASSSTEGELVLRLGEAEPHSIHLATRLELEMRITFTEVRRDGLRVRQELVWISLAGQVSGRDYAFDSRAPEEPGSTEIYAPLFRSLRALIGRPLECEVKDLGRSVRYRPETLELLDSLGGLVQPEDLAVVLEGVFPPLPKAAKLEVGHAESHSRPVHLASFGQLDLGLKQSVAALTESTAELSLTFQPTLKGLANAEGDEELTEAAVKAMENSGLIRIARADGTTESFRSQLKLAIAIREQDLRVEGAVSLQTEVVRSPD